MISAIAVYGSVLGASDRAAIAADHASYFNTKTPAAATTGFKGASGLRFIASSYVDAGANLLFERTQPFTIFAAIQATGRPAMATSGAMLIFCNVGGTPFPGYELWIDYTGNLRTRIINNQPGLNCIDKVGSLPIIDANYHVIGLTYDGSSTAAGTKLFVDGVKDPNVRVITDALSGSTIGTSIRLGNQSGFDSTFYWRGALDEIQVHNVERSESYMAAHMTARTYPDVPDANIVGYWKFDDGSGTSAADASLSGFTGTLTGSPVWLSAAPPISPLQTLAWDTSDADVDPFFYEWWRKKQEEVLSPFAEEIEEQAEPAEATVAEAVKQIGNVQTFNQLDERSALIRADLLETVRELRAEFLRMKEDEDDVETILMLL